MFLLKFVNYVVFQVLEIFINDFLSSFTYLCNHFQSCCTGFTISV